MKILQFLPLVGSTAFWLTSADLVAQLHVDYTPTASVTILDTNFSTATPNPVSGGIFMFRNVTIPPGLVVRGVGPNPMIWIVANDFRIDGTLSVDGGDGERVNTLNSANFPSQGGVAGPAGGAGGRGSPDATRRSFVGEPGYDAFNVPGLGGRGGSIACLQAPGVRGSGGGGGVFTVPGDPLHGTPFIAPQQLGWGGSSQQSSAPVGGAPGQSLFFDGRPENDFFGLGYNAFTGQLIQGELVRLRGGQGGGGGGDYSSSSCSTMDPLFADDAKGGGGGGGGGCLVIYVGGRIIVGAQGRISANGGIGGGGEQAGSNNRGGGGGGGSGGLIILAANDRIDLHVHGDTFALGDSNFSISADGGIGEQGEFGGRQILSKYLGFIPPRLVDSSSGGFGGMGIVQMITRPGNNADGTNTVFDDSIDVTLNGVALTGSSKQSYLAWRGWPAPNGSLVDDTGNATNVGPRSEGDIRPAPILLPLF